VAPAPHPHRDEGEPRALGDDGPRRLIVDQYPGSAVATALEGIARGMVVMLVGTAGVGKSTLAAQAGFMIARQLGVGAAMISSPPRRSNPPPHRLALAG
jgi:MoxR-like ATPase